MARKYPEKYGPLLLVDAALITVFTAFLVVFMWSIIDSVDLFNPFDDYIDNFDYSDIVYSEMSRKDDIYKTDTNIYIVNIGDLSRGELAEKINIIQKFEPRVIGIDAVFREPKTGNIQEIMEDMALKQALNAKPNIIMGSFGIYDEEDPDKAVGIIRTNEFFGDLPYGHCELQNEPQTCREFDKFIRFTDQTTHDTVTVNAFSAAIVRMYDNDMFMRFAKRNKKQLESINYRGGSMPFIKIDYEDVNDSCDLRMLKDNIVLMGYLGMYKGAPMDTIDAFFTPLKRCDGYDAKGIEIHAHAISMIMNDDCLVTFENWQNNLLAFILTFFFVLWLVYWYVFGAKFFDILSKPIQFLLIGVVLLISYYVMKEFGIKVDMMPTGIMLIFCIEVLYLYEETLELFKIDSFITQTFKYTKDERDKVLRSIVRFEFIRNKFKRSDK
ncbi:MAG: CHASE2 domain-containing protein [Bacteroidales bacterium]|nr:CHASE2 domain-containing protein [Bacteroidales bacterium]